ncbi:1-acyl-sn-glycerol-3-phosphate acyltransferase [Longilinea arvoryzae]|uniref:1-acyl-sn-glycerol-3-phosphate acyltransferase n=1 Tax=Longilinea arvoryzae TaxID=360412 RepID=A0A0K8MXH1_9CHLR|nr:hypothetical protein [Longilinea arvoryzae]GAP15963.1 1-acyl-sn-glycerol-3-phosphate acyltransferase [Longilinea arvoryzae]
MNDRLFGTICGLLRILLWRGQTLGGENLPRRGPAIFIGNHSGSLGPIACVSAAGRRMYPWIHSAMLDPHRAPAYLQTDFVEKDLRLKPPASARVAGRLARLTVPLLHSVGCIPVYSSESLRQMQVTLQTSLEHLLAGQCLLVFPEKPEWEEDPATHIHRFSKGVLWLVELYYLKTGLPLRIIPFSVHADHRLIWFHPPLELTPAAFALPGGKESWIQDIEEEVREGYQGLALSS